ncbi:ABC-type transport system involved in multi-copper enzyme maturation permease subunit [Ochrobactrum sp. AN78]|nr:ABC-type transport system involved in multi-copper enzyme maturation permease subunit [Ochrobactrum sp. AN78]
MYAILYVIAVAIMALIMHVISMGAITLQNFFGGDFAWGFIFGGCFIFTICLICQRIEARK